jgi:hypothetical protein
VAREAKTSATGKKPGGKPPQPPTKGPLPSDQINLTDEDSRIMPMAGGGFEQCYNAQAAVAAGSLLVVAVEVVLAPNDKQQLEPMLGKIDALPEELGEPETLLADAGYFSAANVEACAAAGIEPLIAMGRQPHHPPLTERFETAPPAPKNSTPVEAMAHRLKTPEGRDLYALRKQTPEPVFGIIKAALGFRQFSLRGLDKVRGSGASSHGLEYEEDVRPQPRLTRPCAAWRRESRRLPVNRGDHNAIWAPPNVRRKLAEAKSSSAFCYKTSVRRPASSTVS